MDEQPINKDYLAKAEAVFLKPIPEYRYADIISGVDVARKCGEVRKILAVAQNTFRGFHRRDKSLEGAKQAFTSYFLENQREIVDSLSTVKNTQHLDSICDEMCESIKSRLANVKQSQLVPYNKVRKPVDIYVQHLICMADCFSDLRSVLVPVLRLPLDSQIFRCEHIFTDQELASANLTRRSTFQDVRTLACYLHLQSLLSEKANKQADRLRGRFVPVFYDLIWNDRYLRWGGNLFETNPA